MRAEHLKYFVALAENQSVTKTSLEFYTTHQSVSKIIRQLEEEMGTPLFLRSQKGMTLTPAGALLLPVARETLRAFHEVRLEIDHLQRRRELTGTLQLAASPVIAAQALLPLINDFRQLYPGVRYEVREHNVLDILAHVAEHRQALGLVVILHSPAYRDLYTPAIDQVRLHLLRRDAYLCAVSAHSPLARCKRLSLAEFARQPVVAWAPQNSDQPQPLSQVLQQLGPIEPVLTTQSRQLYTQAVASGRFVALATPHLHGAFNALSGEEIVLIPFEEDLSLDIALATHPEPELDEAASAFLELVLAQIDNP